MGCKSTKTSVLMKWLVCASIYILLFGVLNSNKLYLLAFVHIQINLRSLFHLQMYTYSHYIFSSGATLSCCVLVCKNTGTCKVFNAKSSLIGVCMCMCVFRFFFDITEATEDKVNVGPPRDRGENLFKWFRYSLF